MAVGSRGTVICDCRAGNVDILLAARRCPGAAFISRGGCKSVEIYATKLWRYVFKLDSLSYDYRPTVSALVAQVLVIGFIGIGSKLRYLLGSSSKSDPNL